jgi:ABC-2 type transport system ATP-binding protein
MQRSVIPMSPAGAAGPESSGAEAEAGELAVRTAGLSKHYRHPWTMQVVKGLEDLNLEVRRGEVFGYLGPNGAGKTTTLKLLCGLHRATAGEAWLFGVPIGEASSRRRRGFLPEQPYFYDHLNGVEYLEFAARLSGVPAREARRRAGHWLDRVGLGGQERRSLRKYSKGMLQRIGLAAALVHEPDLLILDEPMSGLDPFGRRDVRDLILEQRDRGVTVMFSSHILPDVEMICDRVAILLGGRLDRVATVGEIVASGDHTVEIRCTGVSMVMVPQAWREVLTRREHPHETAFLLTDDSLTTQVLQWLTGQGVQIRAVTPHRPTLETLFMEAAAASSFSAPPRSGAQS